jgi:hypothetical protein
MDTDADHARIRVAVEDHAHRYYGGPLHLGRSDAARYVTEGHLGQHPLKETWQAVAELIEARPEVLTWTAADVAERRQVRAEQCEALAHEAHDHMVAGRTPEAEAAVGRGEVLDPDHRVLGRYSWTQIRKALEPTTEEVA